MCLLTYCPPNTTPSEDDLRRASWTNDDGFGWAVMDLANQQFIIGKSMELKEAMDGFYQAREACPDGPALFHLRIATHGTKDIRNCHPFQVGADGKTIVAHNGILDLRPDSNDWRSDTRLFAEEWLPALGVEALDDPDLFPLVEKWCWGSKLVVMTFDERLRSFAYLINESDGHWNEGCWWSNYSYCQDYYFAASYVRSGGGWVEAGGKDRTLEGRTRFSVTTKIGDRYINRKDPLVSLPSDDEYSGLWSEGYDTYYCEVCESWWCLDAYEEAIYGCPSCQACFECLASSCECWRDRSDLCKPLWGSSDGDNDDLFTAMVTGRSFTQTADGEVVEVTYERGDDDVFNEVEPPNNWMDELSERERKELAEAIADYESAKENNGWVNFPPNTKEMLALPRGTADLVNQ